jgi:hypothetical protein
MELVCVRRGQGEVGVVTHDGRVFAAFGSSVNGRHVTAYTRKRHGRIILTLTVKSAGRRPPHIGAIQPSAFGLGRLGHEQDVSRAFL